MFLSASLLVRGSAAPPSFAVTPTINEFNVPTFGSNPLGVTAGPLNSLWIADSNDFDTHKVEQMTTSGQVTGYNVPGGQSLSCPQGCVDPASIVTAPDGNLWFTELAGAGNAIGQLNPNTGQVTIHDAGITPSSEPWGITVGADNNLWFTENVPGGRIGRITTSGAVTEFPIATTSNAPFGITSGPDGNLWFTEQVYGGAPTKVGVMDTNGRMLTEIDIAGSGVGLSGITVAGSRVWFTETTANSIGWIDATAKTFNPSTQLVGDGTGGPSSIVFRADGFLYFVEAGNNSIGRIDAGNPPSSVGTHFSVPTSGAFSKGSPPQGITVGPDGAIWFVEGSPKEGGSNPSPIHALGRLDLGPLPTPSPTPTPSAAPTTEPSPTPSPTSPTGSPSPPGSPPPPAPGASSGGYWLSATDGGIFNFGDAGFFGSPGALKLNKPVVGMAATVTGQGYWLVASDGGIFSFGDAGFFGSTGAIHLNSPIVGMAASPTGGGYWLVASDGGIFDFGSAGFFGSTGAIHLNKPIVAMAATKSGQGYWLAASDGGIFNFGSAAFFGSTGAIRLNSPIVGMAAPGDGTGYLLTASDGGVFTFGSAAFFGSTGAIHLNNPVVAMAAFPPRR